MPTVNELRERALARWNGASPREKVIALVALATLVTVGFLGYARTTRTEMSVLFSGLAEQDAAGIVARLRETHVPYELGPDGTTILVPTESVHETRLTLAGEGLPAGGGIGFEIFDTQRFGESEFVEQVQYLRALEGELGRTLSHLEGVDSARVHLVLPQRTLLAGEGEQARASIAIRMRPGHRLEAEQIRGVVRLVASSVRDLDPADVTIVDGDGRRLASGDEVEAEGQSTERSIHDAELVRRRIERNREEAIQDLLDRTLGPGVAVARLTAEVSFAEHEQVDEVYDPTQIAPRSLERTTEGGDGEQPNSATAGVAGAVSALPGGPGAEGAAPTTPPGGRTSETINNEITKHVVREREPLGRVTRLSLAVVVDGHWEGEGDERHFVARTPEELDRIRAVLRSAAGLVDARGDTLSVECVPFEIPEAAAATTIVAEAGTVAGVPIWAIVGALVAVVLAIVIAIVVLRRRRAAAAAAAASTPLAISAEPALPTGLEPPNLEAGTGTALDVAGAHGPEKEPDADTIRIRVIDFARRDPELAARIVRGWLLENEGADESPASESDAHDAPADAAPAL